jgi:hypothetical protein
MSFREVCSHSETLYQQAKKTCTQICTVDLVQLIRFLVMKLIHSVLNHRFDMCVIFTINYFLVRDDVSYRQ